MEVGRPTEHGHNFFSEIVSKISQPSFLPDHQEALIGAAIDNDCDTAKNILGSDCDINNRDDEGYQAIHYASGSGHKEMLALLIINGANKDGRGPMGMTSLVAAAYNSQCDTAHALIEAGCNIDDKNEDGDEAIHWAAIKGNADMMNLLLESRANPNAKDGIERTPLILAVNYNHLEIIKVLIEAGCDINSQDKSGYQAIHYAAMNGDKETVEHLLKSHAQMNATVNTGMTPVMLAGRCDIDSKDKLGMTPVMLAAKNNHLATVKVLIEAGCDIDSKEKLGMTPVMLAAKNNHLATVKVLIEAGCEIDSKDKLGMTPVMLAAKNNHLATVKILIEAGCEIDSKDKLGMTPVMLAAKKNHLSTVKVLIEAGCEIDSKDKLGMTPVMLAAKNNHLATVQVLIQAGCSIDSKDTLGKTPVMLASKNNNLATVKVLIEAGCDIDSKDTLGMTPVMLAAKNNHLATVQVLIEAGCEIESKDILGMTPVMLAAKNNHLATVKVLMEAGCEIDGKDTLGMTPVMLAAKNNHLATVKVLIEAGCEIDSKDKLGMTPVMLAAKNNHLATVKVLIEAGCEIDSKDKLGMTPVMLAAKNNHLATVNVLIEAGCDIDSRNKHGNEAIDLSTKNGNAELVRPLLESNANKNATNNMGTTLLMLAVQKNHCEIVKVLIEAGCDIHSRDKHGKQAYDYAHEQGNQEIVDILRESLNMEHRLYSDRSNEESWNFEIKDEEMYMTNGNMSSMMELYIPKGALPSGSSSVMKATIRQTCNQNSETQDQEGQIGPTISLLPHGIKFARPILALIRLPYEDLLNAEEFEFVVLHSDTDDDAPEEWVDITEFKKGETSGLVVPEHNVSMVVLFHFSFLTWFRRRRTKTLQVLVLASLEDDILTVKCLFCQTDSENDKDVNANNEYIEVDRQNLVITSQNSAIAVKIEEISETWKLLSKQNQEVSHTLVWNTNSPQHLRFSFKKGKTPTTMFVCNIVAQQKDAKAAFTVILHQDYLANRQSKLTETSNSRLGSDIEQPELDSCREHAVCDSSHPDCDEPTAAGSECTTKITVPRECRSCYTNDENETIHANFNRPIPEKILNIVIQNRVEIMKYFTMGTVLMNHLKSKEIFTTDQIEKIKIKDGLNKEQADMVLDMLPRISFYHYLMFRDCLSATNQRHVCRYLPKHDGSTSG